jgi:hypothetical protein
MVRSLIRFVRTVLFLLSLWFYFSSLVFIVYGKNCVRCCSVRGKERMVALRPHKPKHIRGGWSHTDTSEPVDGYGAQNMVTVQSRSQTSDLSITGPAR